MPHRYTNRVWASLATFILCVLLPVLVLGGIVLAVTAGVCFAVGVWFYAMWQSGRAFLSSVTGGHL